MPTIGISLFGWERYRAFQGRRRKDVQVFDDELPGFGVRTFSSGAAFSFVKYNVDIQQRRKTVGRAVKGNPNDMRKEASKVLARLGSAATLPPKLRPPPSPSRR